MKARKKAAAKRTKALNLRVTREVHAKVQAAADMDGVTMSGWVSRLLVRALRGEGVTP